MRILSPILSPHQTLMTSTFYLKDPKSKKESLIYFSCHFNEEKKKFVYSTGEKIAPKNWSQENKRPIQKGINKTANATSIRTQINRYHETFEEIRARCKTTDENLTSERLRKEFNKAFKKTPKGKNQFYDVFNEFMSHKIKLKDWSPSTIKRYKNIQNILIDFEKETKYKLTFSTINEKFYAEFTDYCMNKRNHINNTFSRNLGLLKAFLLWAFENGHTYNNSFMKFKKKKRVVTNQVALNKIDLQKIIAFDLNNKRLERVKDVFVFSCITGMRFGELRLFGKKDIVNNSIVLKEEKDSDKETRRIPLNKLSHYVLKKYDYKLPLIANQKQNDYIKEVFLKMGYTNEVVKTTTRGKEVIRKTMPYYERISTHTARRTFITIMKTEKLSDKLIASITGHKDLKTLNQYYQVDDQAKSEAIAEVFDMDFKLKIAQ